MTTKQNHTAKSRPVSVRLTPEERAALERDAKGASLSRHIRARLFDGFDSGVGEMRLSPETRQKLLAQILARLGQMGIAISLSELAELARLGLLDMTPEAERALLDALGDLRDLRRDLLIALGKRPGKGGGE